jgi:folylpolyglutamate synthase/dihydrofolate synthase
MEPQGEPDSDLNAWLEHVQSRGIKVGLGQITKALQLTGEPQKSFASALVGGTNGKGSTVSFAASILRKSGLRVGSTVSPHLLNYRERFRVDGELASSSALNALARRLRPQIEASAELGNFTFFELGVLLALHQFQAEAVEAAVVEVGMGGEFDASRGCEARTAAIVSVDLDHQAFLGGSVAEIARTKARIAEPGGTLVVSESREDRLAPITQEAHAIGCRLFLAGRDFRWTLANGRFSYVSDRLQFDEAVLPLDGAHQGQNAACAVALVENFCISSGLSMPSEDDCVRGIEQTRIPGRFERVSLESGAIAVLDGAHNPAGARALADTLASRPRPDRRVWIFASMADKQRLQIIEAVLPHVDEIICTAGTSSPRFQEPHRLADEVRRRAGGKTVSFALTPREALAGAITSLAADDELLVAGSLYLVGDVRGLLGLPCENSGRVS